MEQQAFHVDKEYSRKQMLAACETVVKMWEARYYEEHSEFLDFPERMVTPKPWQDPHPPVWMACSSDSAAVTAGENGLGMLSFSPVQPVEKTAAQIKAYREASARAKPLTRVTTNKAAGYTLVHCAEEPDDFLKNNVWKAVDWWYRGLVEFILKWEWESQMQPGSIAEAFPMMSKPAEEYDNEDMIIVGNVEKCIAKMKRFADMGVDQLLCYVQFGKIPHEAVMHCIELLGTQVIPVMESYTPVTI